MATLTICLGGKGIKSEACHESISPHRFCSLIHISTLETLFACLMIDNVGRCSTTMKPDGDYPAEDASNAISENSECPQSGPRRPRRRVGEAQEAAGAATDTMMTRQPALSDQGLERNTTGLALTSVRYATISAVSPAVEECACIRRDCQRGIFIADLCTSNSRAVATLALKYKITYSLDPDPDIDTVTFESRLSQPVGEDTWQDIASIAEQYTASISYLNNLANERVAFQLREGFPTGWKNSESLLALHGETSVTPRMSVSCPTKLVKLGTKTLKVKSSREAIAVLVQVR